MNNAVEKVLVLLDDFRTSDEMTYSAYSALSVSGGIRRFSYFRPILAFKRKLPFALAAAGFFFIGRIHYVKARPYRQAVA